MRKTLMLLPLALLAAGAAQAGTYSVLQDSQCNLISAEELARVIHQAGSDTGLDLPKDMAIRAEVQCSRDATTRRFVYIVRAAIEKQVNDGEAQRWAPLVQQTGYGTTVGSAALLRQVHFTIRDVIRQEP